MPFPGINSTVLLWACKARPESEHFFLSMITSSVTVMFIMLKLLTNVSFRSALPVEMSTDLNPSMMFLNTSDAPADSPRGSDGRFGRLLLRKQCIELVPRSTN